MRPRPTPFVHLAHEHRAVFERFKDGSRSTCGLDGTGQLASEVGVADHGHQPFFMIEIAASISCRARTNSNMICLGSWKIGSRDCAIVSMLPDARAQRLRMSRVIAARSTGTRGGRPVMTGPQAKRQTRENPRKPYDFRRLIARPRV
jgi:hypothetical protein